MAQMMGKLFQIPNLSKVEPDILTLTEVIKGPYRDDCMQVMTQ